MQPLQLLPEQRVDNGMRASGMNRVVAAEIHGEENRRGLRRRVRDDQQQIDFRHVAAGNGNGGQLQGRLAIEEIPVHDLAFEIELGRLGRNFAVHVMLKERLQLRAAGRAIAAPS